MAFVVDASMTASWLLPDEQSELALKCYEALKTEEVYVPIIWRMEVWNLLISAERRKRIALEYANKATALLGEYPLIEESGFTPETILEIARTYGLSAYDAMYLDVAQRLQIRLATLDRRLIGAAQSAGVPLVL